ncbi:MAG TPA: hypothetical protein VLV84_01405 [Candidatus Acidoferrales bacterium]|nr:hypothetical protein [Candidatus Acidoferrales bacterium]
MNRLKNRRVVAFRKDRKTGKTIPITAPLAKRKMKVAGAKNFSGIKPKRQLNYGRIANAIIRFEAKGKSHQTALGKALHDYGFIGKKSVQDLNKTELKKLLREYQKRQPKSTAKLSANNSSSIKGDGSQYKVTWAVKGETQNPQLFSTEKEANSFIRKLKKQGLKPSVKIIHKSVTVGNKSEDWEVTFFTENTAPEGKYSSNVITQKELFPNRREAEIFAQKINRGKSGFGATARPRNPETATEKNQFQVEVKKGNAQALNRLNEPTTFHEEMRLLVMQDSPKWKREMHVLNEFRKVGGCSKDRQELEYPTTAKEIQDWLKLEEKKRASPISAGPQKFEGKMRQVRVKKLKALLEEKKAIRENRPSQLDEKMAKYDAEEKRILAKSS